MPLLPLLPWILGGLTIAYVASRGSGNSAPRSMALTCTRLSVEQRQLLYYVIYEDPRLLLQHAAASGTSRAGAVTTLQNAATEVAQLGCATEAQLLRDKATVIAALPEASGGGGTPDGVFGSGDVLGGTGVDETSEMYLKSPEAQARFERYCNADYAAYLESQEAQQRLARYCNQTDAMGRPITPSHNDRLFCDDYRAFTDGSGQRFCDNYVKANPAMGGNGNGNGGGNGAMGGGNGAMGGNGTMGGGNGGNGNGNGATGTNRPLSVGDVAVVSLAGYFRSEVGDPDQLLSDPSIPIPTGADRMRVSILSVTPSEGALDDTLLTKVLGFLTPDNTFTPVSEVLDPAAGLEPTIGVDPNALRTGRVSPQPATQGFRSPGIRPREGRVGQAPGLAPHAARAPLALMRCGVDGCHVRPEPRPWNDAWGRFGFSIPSDYPVGVIAMREDGWAHVELYHPDHGRVDGWIEAAHLVPDSRPRTSGLAPPSRPLRGLAPHAGPVVAGCAGGACPIPSAGAGATRWVAPSKRGRTKPSRMANR